MTVFGMVFERHGREFPVVNGTSLLGQALAGNPADPCNNIGYDARLLRKHAAWAAGSSVWVG